MTGSGVTPAQAEECSRTAPIERELTGRDIGDGDWIQANVARFIRHVKVRDGRRFLDNRWCGGEERRQLAKKRR
jgi:hypothetical protein